MISHCFLVGMCRVNKESKSVLHMVIGSLLKSRYRLHAKIDSFLYCFLFGIWETTIRVKRYTEVGVFWSLSIWLPLRKKENFSRVDLRFCFWKINVFVFLRLIFNNLFTQYSCRVSICFEDQRYYLRPILNRLHKVDNWEATLLTK